MKKSIFAFTLAGMMILASCSDSVVDNANDDQTADEQAIKYVLENDEMDILYDDFTDSNENEFGDYDPNWTGGGMEKDGYLRMRFGRIWNRSMERNIEIIRTSDSTATAYVFRTFNGRFVSATGELRGDTLSLNRFEKRMRHTLERIISLKKRAGADSTTPGRNWKIDAVSLASGKSDPNRIAISKVVVIPHNADSIVIEDPLAFRMTRQNMFQFRRFDEVTVRVYVQNSTPDPIVFPEDTRATENVRLHYGRNRRGHHAKARFDWVGQTDTGQNIYEGTWRIQQFPGFHHAVIDVIDNGTILDDDDQAYPYNSATWGTPYLVLPSN